MEQLWVVGVQCWHFHFLLHGITPVYGKCQMMPLRKKAGGACTALTHCPWLLLVATISLIQI